MKTDSYQFLPIEPASFVSPLYFHLALLLFLTGSLPVLYQFANHNQPIELNIIDPFIVGGVFVSTYIGIVILIIGLSFLIGVYRLCVSEQYILESEEYRPTQQELAKAVCTHILWTIPFSSSNVTIIQESVDSSVNLTCLAGYWYCSISFPFEDIFLEDPSVRDFSVSNATLRTTCVCCISNRTLCRKNIESSEPEAPHPQLYLCGDCLSDCLDSISEETREESRVSAVAFEI